MVNRHEVINIGMGVDRALVTALDRIRASEFLSLLVSGANNYTSGVSLFSVTASNVVRVRPLNIHFHNRETSAMTILFRDGLLTGSIIAGPYILNPTQGVDITYDNLEGRYFLSGIYAVVISGAFGQGIDVNMGIIQEPDSTAAGGRLE